MTNSKRAEVFLAIKELRRKLEPVQDQEPSREIAMCQTKLDEFELWFERHAGKA